MKKKDIERKDGVVTIKDAFILAALASMLAVACYMDIRHQRLPNYLTFSGMAAGIFCQVVFGSGFLFSVKGLLLGTGLLFIPYLLGAMGAGDAKLMGAVGAFIGAEGVFKAFIFTALAGGMYALILMSSNGCLFAAFKRYGRMLKGIFTLGEFIYLPPPEEIRKLKLCYGVAIAVGTVFSVALPYDLLG